MTLKRRIRILVRAFASFLHPRCSVGLEIPQVGLAPHVGGGAVSRLSILSPHYRGRQSDPAGRQPLQALARFNQRRAPQR